MGFQVQSEGKKTQLGPSKMESKEAIKMIRKWTLAKMKLTRDHISYQNLW